jgi:hypothetical protein
MGNENRRIVFVSTVLLYVPNSHILSTALTDAPHFLNPDDDPMESEALATMRECEYCITRACKDSELSSLGDLEVVVLVPCSAERSARFEQVLASLLKC